MYGERVGGVSPHSYGLQISVLVPTATESAPIKAGDSLKLIKTGGYHAAACADGDVIQLKAIHTVKDGKTPLGCRVYGFSRVDKYQYSGEDPVVGDSIVSDGAGAIKRSLDGANGPVDNGSFVLFVDSVSKTVEVAMP